MKSGNFHCNYIEKMVKFNQLISAPVLQLKKRKT